MFGGAESMLQDTQKLYGKKLAATGEAPAARNLDTDHPIRLAPQVSA